MIPMAFSRVGFMISRRCARLGVAALTFGCVFNPVAPRAAEAGLAIVQRSNGLPGSSKTAVTQQRLLVGTGKFRLDDTTLPKSRSVIVRLDKGVIWELDPELELYTESAFAHYREQREEAEQDREKAREAALEKLSGAELDAWLARKGMRKDGKRVVETKRGSWETADGTRLQRVAIELNGVTQVAVWQTDKFKDDYKPPKELFEFYDQCGVFPADVTEALKREVTLFPLRIYANIDLFSAGAVIETRVDGVSHWPEEPERFEVPSTYKLVKEFPKERIAKKEFRCPVCGKVVDPLATEFFRKDKRTGEKLFFDAQECWIEFGVSGPKGNKTE